MRRNALVKTRDRTNPSTQEAEAGRFQKQRQPQLHRKTSLSQKKKDWRQMHASGEDLCSVLRQHASEQRRDK
jgi:hypothetical protein